MDAMTTVRSIIQNGLLANLIRPISPWYLERHPADHNLRQYSSVNWTIITVSWFLYSVGQNRSKLVKVSESWPKLVSQMWSDSTTDCPSFRILVKLNLPIQIEYSMLAVGSRPLLKKLWAQGTRKPTKI